MLRYQRFGMLALSIMLLTLLVVVVQPHLLTAQETATDHNAGCGDETGQSGTAEWGLPMYYARMYGDWPPQSDNRFLEAWEAEWGLPMYYARMYGDWPPQEQSNDRTS